jgi:excisionase family DNA binding protein
MPAREMFSIKEVSEALAVAPVTVRRLVKARKLKAVRFSTASNSQWMISKAALNRFIKQAEAI